jgi:hypothetical protein
MPKNISSRENLKQSKITNIGHQNITFKTYVHSIYYWNQSKLPIYILKKLKDELVKREFISILVWKGNLIPTVLYNTHHRIGMKKLVLDVDGL